MPLRDFQPFMNWPLAHLIPVSSLLHPRALPEELIGIFLCPHALTHAVPFTSNAVPSL